MKIYKKKKGVLSTEFALLLPIILTIFLAMLSIIYTISIKAELDRSISKALEDISSEVYLSSKIIENSGSFEEINSILKPVSNYLGLDIDLNAILNKEIIKLRLRKKTYQYMGFKKNKPFWLKNSLNFDIAYSSNTLIASSKAKIKLPVLNSLLGDIEFERNHIQAARGIDKILNSNNFVVNSNKDKLSITICQYSYSGKNGSPVYHSQKCMGRRNEKVESSLNFELNKNEINKNGTIVYKGKKYRYCKFCQKMEKKKD